MPLNPSIRITPKETKAGTVSFHSAGEILKRAEARKKKSSVPKTRMVRFGGDAFVFPAFTKEQQENRALNFKRNFWTGVAVAANVPSSFVLGFSSSLMTLGLHDSAIYKAQKYSALKKLESDIVSMGYKVKEKVNDQQWKVTNEAGKEASINAASVIKNSFPKNLAQYTAAKNGFELSPEDMFAYNIGKTFGSITSISGGVKKGIAKYGAKLGLSRVAILAQAGTTGAIYGGVEQVRNKLEDKSVSFSEWWRTGGWFAMFGVASQGLSAISNSYKMGKFLKSPEGQNFWIGLKESDRKFLLKVNTHIQKAAQKSHAEEAILTDKLYQSQAVKPTGYKSTDLKLAKKIFAQPTMTQAQIKRTFGPRMIKLAKKLDVKYAKEAEAGKAGEAMTKDLLAAPGKPKPVPNLMRRAKDVKMYRTVSGNDYNIPETRVILDSKGNAIFKKTGEKVITESPVKIPKENPYPNMPIAEVENLANYGVQGAKDYLSETNISPLTPATNGQRENIIKLSAKYGLGEENLRTLMHQISSVNEIEEMTKEEAGELLESLRNYQYMSPRNVEAVTKAPELLVARGMLENEMEYLRKIAGSDVGYNNTVNYMNMLGGFPTDESLPDLVGQQKEMLRDLRIVAKRQKQFLKKQSSADENAKQANMLGTWQHIGYALDLFEQRSGVPLRRDWKDAVAIRNSWHIKNEDEVWNAAKKAGISRLGRMTNLKTNQQIIKWLDEIDEEVRAALWNGMDEKTRNAAIQAEELYQGPSAMLLRYAQYKNWDFNVKKATEMLNLIKQKGKTPSKKQIQAVQKLIKKAKPYNATNQDLIDARAAFSIDQGMEYLDAAIWGTRARYAPHEVDLRSLMNTEPGGSIPQEIFFRQAGLGTLGKKTPGSIYPRRKKGAILKSGNVFLDILNHMNRLSDYASTFDLTEKMWGNLQRANLSTTDEANFRKMMDSLRGIRHPIDSWVKAAGWTNSWFWRNFLVLDPRGSVKFAWRQMFQNPALAPSQFNTMELAKAFTRFPHFTAAKKWMENNPDAKESFDEFYNRHVAENKAVYRHMLANSNSYSGLGLVSKAGGFFDLLGFTPAVTDRFNRKMVWPVAYWMAESNIEAFKAGKINTKALWKKLSINDMPTSYSIEMRELLKNKNYSEFKSRYAEYKTEAIHMRYNPLLRSTQEMNPLGRLIFGPVVFARGVANIAIKQGLEPMLYGDTRRAWSGFKTVTKLLLGGMLANDVSERTFGYSIYDVPRIIMGIGPLAPGAGSIVEIFNEVNAEIRQAPPGTSPGELALKMAKVGAKNLESFIGIADVALDYYKVQNDLKYVHLWDLAREAAKSDWEKLNNKPFKRSNRSVRDKITIMIFDVEPKTETSSWQTLQKSLSSKRKRTFKGN